MQGDIQEHEASLKNLGLSTIWVRKREDLDRVAALFLPGGESTTMLRLLEYTGLDEAIIERYNKGTLPMFAVCAGIILLAREVDPVQPSLGILGISVKRNAYGRQVESFEIPLQVKGLDSPFNGIFIRAPIITACDNDIEILAEYKDSPVLVKKGSILGMSFHPELTRDYRIHKIFLKEVKAL